VISSRADARTGRAAASAAIAPALKAKPPQVPRLPDRRAEDPAKRPVPDNWIYIHDSKVKVGRIQNFRSWSPEMVPDESVACVGLEYFCFEGDGLWSSMDDDLIALATREMAILGWSAGQGDRRRGGPSGKGLSGL
jgi:hypothetical protein